MSAPEDAGLNAAIEYITRKRAVTVDTHKACQYCGKPFESVQFRGDGAGKPKGAPLLMHEMQCPENPQRKRWPQK